MGIEVPFQHTLLILGPQGEVVRVAALFDGCVMVAAMCVMIFEKVKHRLGEWKKSKRIKNGEWSDRPIIGSMEREDEAKRGGNRR